MGTKVRSRGLILLVVLGMLSLFSLLAVTFVVFSGQSRVASLQMAGRDFRGTPPDRLLDQAIKQVVRGTVDTDSALWRQSLLDDLYGALESPISTSARFSKSDITGRTYPPGYTAPSLPLAAGAPQGPKMYTGTPGQFLKIPLEWSQDLPLHHDALTGRVITFLEGPLANQSLRIMRYIGAVDDANLPTYDTIQYAVLVDLSEVMDRVVSAPQFTSPASVMTKSVREWIQQDATGAPLLYRGTTGTLTSPYSLMINAGAQNGPGIGINFSTTLSGTTVNPTTTPTFLIARSTSQPPNNQLQSPYDQVPDALLPNFAQTHLITRYGQSYSPDGDTDEPYDAADYNNFFLSLRRFSNSLSSDDVIPAFHRPEVINFLASLDSSQLTLSGMSAEKFLSFLEVLQRASARPLSYRITRFPDANGNPVTLQNNMHFTGGSSIESNNGLRNPQLQFDWQDRTTSAAPQDAFDAWLRWNLRGSWDVDNDGDTIKDSVWVDLNYPLSTAPDGKLLKVLAAFYIEDMDGKIDINAAGSQIQAIDTTSASVKLAYPLTLNSEKYAYLQNYPQPGAWPQGLGFGPADIYLRHLFDSGTDQTNVLQWRYDGNPGIDSQDDSISKILAHWSNNTNVMRPSRPTHARLPGLPVSTHGRLGIALDLLGNPILMNTPVTFSGATFLLEEEKDDPYEARVLSEGSGQRGISFAEWERLVRFNDLDRSSLPAYLEQKAGGSWSMINGSGALNTEFLKRIHSLSPRNVALNTPRFNRVYSTGSNYRRVSSFVEFVEEYLQRRASQNYPAISNAAMMQLFPIEFAHNLPLNLNRPLGNGVDDNNNGEVDEPAELANNLYYDPVNSTEKETYGTLTVAGDYTQNAAEFDPSWDPLSATPSQLTNAQFQPYIGNRSRQLLARHLYCLAQLILPVNTSGVNAYVFPNQPTATPVDNETRARILAQWAVNVVDFGDADAAMTRFSYDSDPFYNNGTYAPGWLPDGNHVVFGFEQPELLITESLATHDTRIRRRDPPKQGYDQIRVPEGSLFLEFYCPRSTATVQAGQGADDDLLPGLPASLYGVNPLNSTYSLDLSRLDTASQQYPVWRVLLLEPTFDTNAPTTDPMTTVYEGDASTDVKDYGLRAFNYSYQLGNTIQTTSTASKVPWRVGTAANDGGSLNPVPEPKVDRVLWFTNQLKPTSTNIALSTNDLSAGATTPEARVYYYRTGGTVMPKPMLQGGQYLVVGPRPITYFGSKSPAPLPRQHRPNNHRIMLMSDWVQIFKQDKTPALWRSTLPPPPSGQNPPNYTPATWVNVLRDCVTMVAGADMPAAWTSPPDPDITQQYVGLNISEPTPDNYYPVPTMKVSTDTTTDPDNGAPSYDSMSKDGYVDLSGATATGTKDVFDGGTPNNAYFLEKHKWPVSQTDNCPKPQTQKNWSAAVLQRLADPALPWHPALNPYITVDWHSIDLTVFSGEDKVTDEGDYFFASRAKTGQHTKVTIPAPASGNARTRGNLGETFFSYETSFPTTPSVDGSGATDVYFKKELLSEWYAGQTTASAEQTRGVLTSEFASLGYLNRSYILRGYPNTNEYQWAYYQGGPSRTPDAPFFPNRSYINRLELANVPISGPGTFHQEFYFEPAVNIPPNPPVPRHRHTLDFEQLLGSAPKTTAELLDMVAVPSPWPDSWNVANPNAMKPGDAGGVALLDPYQPPFNFIPTYREPGRINLNTVTEPLVARGLMANLMANSDRLNAGATVPYVQQLSNAITGIGSTYAVGSVFDSRAPGTGNPNLSGQIPTLFPGVFTNTGGGFLFPYPQLQRFNPVDTTLFRRAVPVPQASPTTNQRALDPSLLTSISPGNVPVNNSFTFNLPATRLANLTTDRSNVFAVRVTLGYFEYSPDTGLGVEYGSEQGMSRRNRAFYLIDRSIPVGFQTGKDLNTSDCILVRRVIE